MNRYVGIYRKSYLLGNMTGYVPKIADGAKEVYYHAAKGSKAIPPSIVQDEVFLISQCLMSNANIVEMKYIFGYLISSR